MISQQEAQDSHRDKRYFRDLLRNELRAEETLSSVALCLRVKNAIRVICVIRCVKNVVKPIQGLGERVGF